MIFLETEIESAFVIELDARHDERGLFGRVWCAKEFAAHGVDVEFVQANIAYSGAQGTVRGMHYQVAPSEEAKLVRCTRGAVFDVAVDLRPSSPSYLAWIGIELTESNRRALFVPAGCAHGYQTLADDSEVLYLVSSAYDPGAEKGFRYDDPEFAIRWPLEVSSISDKDRSWPAFHAELAAGRAHRHQGLRISAR